MFLRGDPMNRKEFMISPFIFSGGYLLPDIRLVKVYLLTWYLLKPNDHGRLSPCKPLGSDVIWRHGILWPNPSSACCHCGSCSSGPGGLCPVFPWESATGWFGETPWPGECCVYASWSIRKLMQCVGRCTRNGGKVWVILGLCGTWSQLVVGWWYLLKRNPIGKNLAKVVLGGVVWVGGNCWGLRRKGS